MHVQAINDQLPIIPNPGRGEESQAAYCDHVPAHHHAQVLREGAHEVHHGWPETGGATEHQTLRPVWQEEKTTLGGVYSATERVGGGLGNDIFRLPIVLDVVFNVVEAHRVG